MTPTILFVGGGTEIVPAVKRAMDLGCRVLVADRDPNAPGCRVADGVLKASAYHPDEVRRAALAHVAAGNAIDAVLALATDCPNSVAAVAEALELPGPSVAVGERAVDKLAMKNKFAADGVAQPWFIEIRDLFALRRHVAAMGFPVVLKPADSRGARGVLRLTGGEDLAWAFRFAMGFSPSRRLVLERFVDGPQISTESLVVDGVAHTPGFSDRNYELIEAYAPHIIENGGDLPSFLPAPIQDKVRTLVDRAAASLGVRNGVVKGDIVVREGEPMVIEMAARLSGGYFCSHEIPLNTGVDFVGAAIRQALGETIDPAELAPRFQRHVSQRYLFPHPGQILAIDGARGIPALPGVSFFSLRCKVGDVIGPIDCHPARGGVVIATGADRETAQANARRAIDAVEITTTAVVAAE
ncbi:MAG: ATP-grasp domain-containing protein [Alphaproteobacteria bacterium]